jgi:2-polyprenyl-6-methoxyphenol hydroxylase-like FAD-dependent oxidoreductase
MTPLDVRILGSGIVSRALGLALARQGLSVGVDARPAPGEAAVPDVRTYALNGASIQLLSSLKVWDALPESARTPVHDMRVAGDGGGEIDFSAWTQSVPALAWIADAAELEAVLETAARFAHGLHLLPPDGAAAGAQAPLTVIAEGKYSAHRDDLGLQFERHPYGHRALAARLASDQPHAGVARQWFGAPDVLGLLPFDRPAPARSYGLVWSLPEARANELAAASAQTFEAALAEATQGAAGTLTLASERATWPLMQARADRVAGPGWALVGDAAHVVHPLAGQGLNLGLGDVVALSEVIAARESWRGLGDPALLARYARRRLLPVRAMSGVVDGLWQLFSSQNPAAKELRNRGMSLVNQLGPVKRFLVARALEG